MIPRFLNHEFLLDAPGARDEYLRRCGLVFGQSDWCPLCFSLMSTHVHHALGTGRSPLERWAKPLHTGFAGWLNRQHGRLGPAFAQRPTAVLVPEEATAYLIAYIHNNEVRAGLITDPADSEWSSHRAFLGLVAAPAWLDVELALSLCGFDSSPAGRLSFHDFVLSCIGDVRDVVLSGVDQSSKRMAARLDACAPVEVTNSRVCSLSPSRSTVELVRRPADRQRRSWRGGPLELLRFVCRKMHVPLSLLRSGSRQRTAVRVRRVALYVWYHELGRPLCEMAGCLGVSASGASNLLTRSRPEDLEEEAKEMLELLPDAFDRHRG